MKRGKSISFICVIALSLSLTISANTRKSDKNEIKENSIEIILKINSNASPELRKKVIFSVKTVFKNNEYAVKKRNNTDSPLQAEVNLWLFENNDSNQVTYFYKSELNYLVKFSPEDFDKKLLFKSDIYSGLPKFDSAEKQNITNYVKRYFQSDLEKITSKISKLPCLLIDPSKKENKKYVASKNSKVFHLKDCSAAKRISEKNLKEYDSRMQALADGKRPCKICKP